MTLTPTQAIALIPPGDTLTVSVLFDGSYVRRSVERWFLERLIVVYGGAEVSSRVCAPPLVLVSVFMFDADADAWACLGADSTRSAS